LRTNYVLIDYENLQPEHVEALLADHFKVMVFVGVNQKKVPVDLALSVQRLGAERAEYIKVSGGGRDALDCHIAYYIGRLAERDPTGFFHIISKDTGFDALIRHLRDRKILSARSEKIEDIPLVRIANTKSPGERARWIEEKLRRPNATRPRTAKTLSSFVAAVFHKQLGDEDVARVVEALSKSGFLKIADGKVRYAAA
jgi:hypothetical protein